MAEPVIVLWIPQLRQRDLTPGALASLERLVGRGGVISLCPAFPSLTAAAFTTMTTGVSPASHGIIGDRFFDRTTLSLRTRPFQDSDVQAPRLWETARARQPALRTLAWFTPSLRGANVDVAAWVDADGLRVSPPELEARLLARLGPYPAPRCDPSGEPLRLASTQWILKSAALAIAETRPDLGMIRIPYLGQVARRFGPDSPQAGRAVLELQRVLEPFLSGLDRGTTLLAVTESVSTPVEEAVYPNLVLRGLGLLELTPAPGGGMDIDVASSPAFAVVDHQLCHIYVNDPSVTATIASTFAGPDEEEIATVASGPTRRPLGLGHPRAGDVVLVARPAAYFAPDWWTLQTERPMRPGQGSGLASVMLDRPQVQGSLGAPPPSHEYHGVVLASRAGLLPDRDEIGARDVPALVLAALGHGS